MKKNDLESFKLDLGQHLFATVSLNEEIKTPDKKKI